LKSLEGHSDKRELLIWISQVKARYEDKVLKPLGELDLKEGDEVEIKVRGSATSRIFGIVKCWEGLEEAHENYETNRDGHKRWRL
jgi:predicted DNA-binding antitoxin AbrB/MazE fold protein